MLENDLPVGMEQVISVLTENALVPIDVIDGGIVTDVSLLILKMPALRVVRELGMDTDANLLLVKA